MGWPKGVPRSPETIAKLTGPRIPLEVRYWAKVDVREPGECWPWTAPLREDGYGQIGLGAGGSRSGVAHRVGYELAYGPIPEGLVVDHDCHNLDPDCPGGPCSHRACQNPAHFLLRTLGDNVLAGKSFASANTAKTHCDAGHPFDAANTYIRPSGGWRDCRKCRAEAEARRRRKIGNVCEVCSEPISPQSKRCVKHRRTR